MKRNRKQNCCIAIIMLFVICVINGSAPDCLAAESKQEEEYQRWYSYVCGEIPDVTINEGETKEITIEVKANFSMFVHKIKVCTQDTPYAVKETPKLYKENMKDEVNSLGSEKRILKFSLYGKKSEVSKTYNIVILFLVGDGEGFMQTVELMDGVTVAYQIAPEDKGKGSVVISDVKCASMLKLGEGTNVSYKLSNVGDGKMYDITIKYGGFEDAGLVPGFQGTTKKIASMDVNKEIKFNYSVKVAKNAIAGTKRLSIVVTYKAREEDREYKTETESFFVEIVIEKKVEPKIVKSPKILIANVKQSVKEPVAGGTVALSFTVENIGLKEGRNITITPTNLSNENFTPLGENPSIYIRRMKPGEVMKYTLRYQLSKKIQQGLHNIDLSIIMKDDDGVDYSNGVRIYVKNVKGKKDTEPTGVPKLIVQNYTTGKNRIKAGDEFMLGLDIANTHKSFRVTNIKVNIMNDETGTFAVSKGNSSFYIPSIKAGKTIHKEVPIKVKPDCVAKTYQLKISFEYEYKGLVYTKDTSAAGFTTSETLNIQVEEDSRPSITHIVPGAYGDLVCGEYNGITFEFNNSGKTPLYNVKVRLKGDFRPTQKTYSIGTVQEGTIGVSHEIEITPTIVGTAIGTLVVTYEDNNGEKGKIIQNFSGNVISGDETNLEDIPSSTPAKKTSGTSRLKALLAKAAFAAFEGVLFLLSAAVVYRVLIIRNNKKMLEEE